jgi:hypothetical protein
VPSGACICQQPLKISCPAARRHPVGPCRRQGRPQGNAGADRGDHGHRHRADRLPGRIGAVKLCPQGNGPWAAGLPPRPQTGAVYVVQRSARSRARSRSSFWGTWCATLACPTCRPRRAARPSSAAAWRFMKFITGPEGATIMVKGTGYMPPNSLPANDPKMLKDFYAEKPNHLTSLSQHSLMTAWYAFPRPSRTACRRSSTSRHSRTQR